MVHVDTSNYAIRATLAQVGVQGLDHLVFFVGHLLSKAQNEF